MELCLFSLSSAFSVCNFCRGIFTSLVSMTAGDNTASLAACDVRFLSRRQQDFSQCSAADNPGPVLCFCAFPPMWHKKKDCAIRSVQKTPRCSPQVMVQKFEKGRNSNHKHNSRFAHIIPPPLSFISMMFSFPSFHSSFPLSFFPLHNYSCSPLVVPLAKSLKDSERPTNTMTSTFHFTCVLAEGTKPHHNS